MAEISDFPERGSLLAKAHNYFLDMRQDGKINPTIKEAKSEYLAIPAHKLPTGYKFKDLLSDLEEAGFIEVRDKRITILEEKVKPSEDL